MTSKPITLAPATVDPRILRVRGIQVLVDADLGDDVASWSLVVKVFAEGGDVYENRLVWK